MWHFGGTTTYYRNARGRIVTNSPPWRYVDYWRRVHEPDFAEFITTRGTVATAQESSGGAGQLTH